MIYDSRNFKVRIADDPDSLRGPALFLICPAHTSGCYIEVPSGLTIKRLQRLAHEHNSEFHNEAMFATPTVSRFG